MPGHPWAIQKSFTLKGTCRWNKRSKQQHCWQHWKIAPEAKSKSNSFRTWLKIRSFWKIWQNPAGLSSATADVSKIQYLPAVQLDFQIPWLLHCFALWLWVASGRRRRIRNRWIAESQESTAQKLHRNQGGFMSGPLYQGIGKDVPRATNVGPRHGKSLYKPYIVGICGL